MQGKRMYRFYDWIGEHVALVGVMSLVVVIGLGVVGPMIADTGEPNFDPQGEIFDVAERAAATLRSESTIESATFIVEAVDGGNVLTTAALREWSSASNRVRETYPQVLEDSFDQGSDATVSGVWSIADVVDMLLEDGLASADDRQVTDVLDEAFADGSSFAQMQFSLAESAERGPSDTRLMS